MSRSPNSPRSFAAGGAVRCSMRVWARRIVVGVGRAGVTPSSASTWRRARSPRPPAPRKNGPEHRDVRLRRHHVVHRLRRPVRHHHRQHLFHSLPVEGRDGYLRSIHRAAARPGRATTRWCSPRARSCRVGDQAERGRRGRTAVRGVEILRDRRDPSGTIPLPPAGVPRRAGGVTMPIDLDEKWPQNARLPAERTQG